MKRVDLSVAVTAHNEGIIAHKTILSLFAAVEKLEEKNISYEFLVHIDNGDKETIEYFKQYEKNKKFRIFQNHFGDLGSSRNFLSQNADGECIAFLDADDLVSANWLITAYETLKNSKQEAVIHPEAVLTFGLDIKNVLMIQKDSLKLTEQIPIMVGENCWCSVVMAKTETLLKIPYHKLGNGYGYEDYIFNLETMYANIDHLVAKETVLFYRRSNTSMLSTNNSNSFVIPYVDIFDVKNIQKLYENYDISKIGVPVRTKGYALYKKIRNNKFLNFFITPVAKLTLKIMDKHEIKLNHKRTPDFLIREWTEINRIETQLYPHWYLLEKLTHYNPAGHVIVGKTFIQIVQKLKFSKPDFIFVVPWVIRGGADKVLFNMIRALKDIHPDWNFTVISTLSADNIWAKRLPEYVDFIDFNNETIGLSKYQQDNLFSRLITQLSCKNIHIINSELAYDWAIKHTLLLKKNFNLTASVFNTVYIEGSNNKGRMSYANPYILLLRDTLKKVYTDNQTVIDEYKKEHYLDQELFKVHYQPITDECQTPIVHAKGKLKILWAGRITYVKLPNIVKAIGEKLPSTKFEIDVYGNFSEEINPNYFDDIETINYRGHFDGFSSIPTNDYDLLLYTSEADGIPNIILEATAAGLPIIASNDGGVKEFIQDKKTGILIENPTNVDDYIKELKNIQKDKSDLETYVKNAQKLLKKNHSYEVFVKTIAEDFKDK